MAPPAPEVKPPADPRVPAPWVPLEQRELPDGVSVELVAKICDQIVCGGRFADLKLYRDAEGTLVRLYWTGDPQACSHPPAGYYSTQGVLEKPIPNKPMSREDVEALHAPWTDGLTLAEEISDPCAR